jgi:ribosomal protein L28
MFCKRRKKTLWTAGHHDFYMTVFFRAKTILVSGYSNLSSKHPRQTITTTSIEAMASLKEFGRVFARAFHSTPVECAKHSKRRLQHILRNVPKYPYPIKHTFKQSWFGLYGGKHIQFGNNVPENFLRYKTRRQWLPNVRHRSVYSRALGRHFSLDITASVLRMYLGPFSRLVLR